MSENPFANQIPLRITLTPKFEPTSYIIALAIVCDFTYYIDIEPTSYIAALSIAAVYECFFVIASRLRGVGSLTIVY